MDIDHNSTCKMYQSILGFISWMLNKCLVNVLSQWNLQVGNFSNRDTREVPVHKEAVREKKIRLVANQLCRSLCYYLQKIYGTVIFQQIDSLHIFTEKIKLEKSLVCLRFHQSTKKSCNWNHAIPPKSLKYVKMCGSIHGWHFGPVNTFHSLKNRIFVIIIGRYMYIQTKTISAVI